MTQHRSTDEIRRDLALEVLHHGDLCMDFAGDRLIGDVAPLLARVSDLERIIAAQLGECEGCTDEPQEFCPHHGRNYSNLLGYLDDIARERSELLARAERAEADLVDAREFVRSNHARADRAERHADSLRRRCERAAVDLRQVAEAHLYDGDTDQPINDGYHALYGVAAGLSGPSQ